MAERSHIWFTYSGAPSEATLALGRAPGYHASGDGRDSGSTQVRGDLARYNAVSASSSEDGGRGGAMDDQTPEMERVTIEMRELMRLWIDNPDNEEIKRRYQDAQAAYQRMFLAYRKGQTNGVA